MTSWKPLETAPKDGSVILIMQYHEKVPEFYSAWWCPIEKTHCHESGTYEYNGHCWVLNDDQQDLIEEDVDLSKWYWQPLPNMDGVANDIT